MISEALRRDAADVIHPPAGAGARIVCLVPSLTETLFALGLGSRVVGRTGFCVHPRERVRAVAKVGGTKDVRLDKVRALRPTHLIVNVDENRRETVDALRDDVAHVIVTHPLTPADNVSLYRLLGAIFGCEAEAAALSAQFCEAAERLRQAVLTRATERVLYLIWRAPWYTVSRETYISATLALCGWLTFPAVAPVRYPTLEDDDPLWHDVDRILLSTEPYVFRERDVARLRERLQQRFGTSPAVSLIDGEMTSWYGSRAIMGLEYLRRLRSE